MIRYKRRLVHFGRDGSHHPFLLGHITSDPSGQITPSLFGHPD